MGREGNTKNRKKEDTRICLRLVTANLNSVFKMLPSLAVSKTEK